MIKNKIPVTQLIIGPAQATSTAIQHQLRTLFCVRHNDTFCSCIACKQITARQHHAIRWLSPEKQQYTLAQLEPVFDEVRFALDANTYFVFVFEQADALSLACANSLLKTLEEPAQGYHFILTTQYPALVLPTIYSRCVVHECKGSESSIQAQHFLSFFKNPQKGDLYECMKELDKIKVTENMTKMLMDELLHYWLVQYTNAIDKNDTQRAEAALRYMDILTKYLAVLPMPGSAKLFWKTVYTAMLF